MRYLNIEYDDVQASDTLTSSPLTVNVDFR